ncbi:hypothetical protein [Pseudonocardia lacus]|uniref:hypothetical protein n=1 Tax=Pseudonocardia lacus TaxID=2835865 RepID=UPI001BDCC2FC|nr:hypothetical protein [Pseudonocardia lacus]
MRRTTASAVVALVALVAAVTLPGTASAAGGTSPELGIETTGGVIDGGTGYPIVEGTVTCSEAARVRVSGDAVQFSSGAFGMFDAYVDCLPGGPVVWDAVLPHLTGAPFEPGELSVSTRASAGAGGVERFDTVTLGFTLVG